LLSGKLNESMFAEERSKIYTKSSEWHVIVIKIQANYVSIC
jgi:hypothetical protein